MLSTHNHKIEYYFVVRCSLKPIPDRLPDLSLTYQMIQICKLEMNDCKIFNKSSNLNVFYPKGLFQFDISVVQFVLNNQTQNTFVNQHCSLIYV